MTKRRNRLIDKIFAIKNKNFLDALDKLIPLNTSDSGIVELTNEQKEMLEMSESDIENDRLISQEAMAKRTIVWTKTADIQFVGILEYWVKRNKSNTYSRKLIRLVTKKTNQIAETPFIYKSTDFKDIRVVSMGNYSIFYKVTKKQNNYYCVLGQPARPEKTSKDFKGKKITQYNTKLVYLANFKTQRTHK